MQQGDLRPTVLLPHAGCSCERAFVDSGLEQGWFADDGHLFGHPVALERALDHVLTRGTQLGLYLNRVKSAYTARRADCFSGVLSTIKWTPWDAGIKVLGTP